MKGLTGIINNLQAQAEKLEKKIATIEEDRDAVEIKAIDSDREMSAKEQAKYDALDEQIDALNGILIDLEAVILQLEEV